MCIPIISAITALSPRLSTLTMATRMFIRTGPPTTMMGQGIDSIRVTNRFLHPTGNVKSRIHRQLLVTVCFVNSML